jgi:ketosteroid isomerase-like protein
MPTLSKSLKVFAGLVLSALAASGADENALRSLVEAENNFARTSVERGIRESFLQFFAEDSIIFAPEPKNAKKFYTDYQDKGRKLMWRPIFAMIASSGELGVTTGPWEMQKSKTEPTPIAFGDFLSIWKKQRDNSWKVIVDVGVDHPQPGDLPSETQLLPPSEPPAKVDVDLARRGFQKAEKMLAEMLNKGAGEAILAAASNDVRVLREESYPGVGREEASVVLFSHNTRTTRQNSGGGLSASGDLAYRYGSYSAERGNATEHGYFLTIWKAGPDHVWKILVDLQKKAPNE